MKSLPLAQTVADFFSRHALPGSAGVLALSGGPDSVCLALLLHDLHGAGVIPRLILAHFNHLLRGAASDADEAFVLNLARLWNLPCRTKRCDVAAAAKADSANLEETARRLRYDWFTEIAREEEAAWIATGHSADDQAETVLFRLLRGTGLQGLAGMAEQRELAANIRLIRPLLQTKRHTIMAFLAHHQQSYCQDRSNEDARFTRNRLRHRLLPLLADEYNPAIADVLGRLAEQARDVQEEIVVWANQLLTAAELPRAGAMIVLDAAVLRKGSRHVQRELLRLIWQREDWPMGQMDFKAWDRLARLAQDHPGAVDLPGGVHARHAGRVLQLVRTNALTSEA